MDERIALFQTIIESPDDPVPRLVFADWLEEHGEETRAEFIRVGCRRAMMADDEPGYDELAQRERELWNLHRDQWMMEFPTENARDLSLPMGTITSVGALAIANSERLPNLHRLRIPQTALTDDTIVKLRGRFGSQFIPTDGIDSW